MIKLSKFVPEVDYKLKITYGIITSLAAGIIGYLSIFGLAGRFGDFVGSFIGMLLGRGAFILPLMFFIIAVLLIRKQKHPEEEIWVNFSFIWGSVLIILAINGYLSMFFGVRSTATITQGGGLVGYIMYPVIFGYFGFIGGFILLFCVALYGFFLLSQITFVEFVGGCKKTLKNPERLWEFVPDITKIFQPMTGEFSGKEINEHIRTKKPKSVKDDNGFSSDFVEEDDEPIILPPSELKPKKRFSSDDEGNIELQPISNSDSNWKLPDYNNLKTSKTKSEPGDIAGNKIIVKNTLEQFGIKVEMDNEYIGPTVTQYTFKPANGVRLSTIDSLQRDLALALASSSIRIEAPIAGKSLVGIEIPNQAKSQVRLGEIAKQPKFVQSKDELPIIIGKDVRGEDLIMPLSKMPHLLVAGATGAGKSVWINGLLLSLLIKYSPFDLQLVLVDMKRVELKLYEGVPHLLSNVIIEADKAINSLKWTVIEMDRRYTILEKYGKRNIKDYNNFVDSIPSWIDTEEEKPEKMPYIVFVIDELGDLMMLAKTEVEPIIVRLTQMSRAVGIHLVLGTQRPDTNVVTGLIKANVPTRIAFTVASQIDSRVILDSTGAEKLLGQGDGLITSPSFMKPIRFQGPNVDEDEVKK
ncbi:hypothetical protein HC864_03670 [Candidatus Gracilibacteria bacterium]|nr:hypothetical protein [Candidatus Gracilibacteria bacterium]